MEVGATYGTPNYLEKVQSQLPALQLLAELGWDYLTPEECVKLRGGRLGSAILEPVLLNHIREHCRFEFKGRDHPFTENAIANAVQALKAFRATGATYQNEQAYDLLCLGTSVPQTVDGDTKSFTINYIDWKEPDNNTYHCTAEYTVERIGHQKHYVPDIVLFINGIPVVVIECKRSAYTDEKNKPIDAAIGQLHDYQARDGIPQLFLYAQLLIALARDKAEYGTTGTPRSFWTVWKEDGLDEDIRPLISTPLPETTKLFRPPFAAGERDFRRVHGEGRAVYQQDRALYALCRRERLLDLMYKFIVFDNGEKKIARYQQYFSVQSILERIRSGEADSARPGGVVWHTQGSGKSLTMVMLAKSLVLAPDIPAPKVILVTDRIDLDNQLCGTFRACGMEPEQANTGEHLVELIMDNKRHVITTLIHKFAAAARNRKLGSVNRNTFVLVDEGHRSNYAEHHARMRLALKHACFVAFTGTPLAKDAKRNTFLQFGALLKPAYTIVRAVEDHSVTPLLYEARHVPQPVDEDALDSWFEKLTLGMTPAQRADLKRKFSSERQLNKAAQKVRMIAWDVSLHYAMTYQGTGMKGQLVAPDKATALRYKKFFDEFAQVRTEVLISSPQVRNEGEGTGEATEEEKTFWKGMMDRYGSEGKYNKQLVNAFKHGDEPEIIIVVDKLLTGFDAPCNTVLYLCRRLTDHTLLQAIARVNRLFPGKQYGLILDYSGVIKELDEAIDFYANLAAFDQDDLDHAITYLEDESSKLPQIHSDLWELFAEVRSSTDPEVYEQHLRDEERRNRFYDRFGAYARTLSLALASTTFLAHTPESTISRYKRDLKFFQNLRAAVSLRFQERVDFSEYEPRIKKLLDTHIGAAEVQQLCDPTALFDDTARQKLLEDTQASADARADRIASAAQRIIEKEMDKDPAFYRKFSLMIEDILRQVYEGRMLAIDALPKLADAHKKVSTHTDDSVPAELAAKDMARRYYGCVREDVTQYTAGDPKPATRIALAIVDRIQQHKIRDWIHNDDAINRMRGEIDDIIFEVMQETGIEFPLELQDKLIDQCIEVARANEPSDNR
ncbi:MAG: HsdR family type I site-specific deoxyribonuclease [Candidatus Marinimicrobia bacterium]|nr:HsdR family type I site-specific deoxyribonuclease [Candidatus Neomarinimicrobiota bacterium]